MRLIATRGKFLLLLDRRRRLLDTDIWYHSPEGCITELLYRNPVDRRPWSAYACIRKEFVGAAMSVYETTTDASQGKLKVGILRRPMNFLSIFDL